MNKANKYSKVEMAVLVLPLYAHWPDWPDAYEVPTLLTLAIGATVLVWSGRVAQRKEVVIAFLLLSAIGVLGGWIGEPQAWLGVYGDRFGFVAMFLLALVVQRIRELDKSGLQRALLLFASTSAFISILQYHDLYIEMTNSSTPSKLGGLMGNPNGVVFISLIGVLIALRAFESKESGVGRTLLVLALTLNLSSLLLVGGGLGAIASAIILLALIDLIIRCNPSFLVAVGVVGVWSIFFAACRFDRAFIPILMLAPIGSLFLLQRRRGTRLLNVHRGISALAGSVIVFAVLIFWMRDERFDFAVTTLRVLKDNLFFGIGPARFSDYSQGYGADLFRNEGIYVESPHNYLLQFLLWLGLSGVFLFGVVFYRAFRLKGLKFSFRIHDVLAASAVILFSVSSIKTSLAVVAFVVAVSQTEWSSSNEIRPPREIQWLSRLCASALLIPVFWVGQGEALIAQEVHSGGSKIKSTDFKWNFGEKTGDLRFLANSVQQGHLEGQPMCRRAKILSEDWPYRPEVLELSVITCAREGRIDVVHQIVNDMSLERENHRLDINLLDISRNFEDSKLEAIALSRVEETWTWCNSETGDCDLVLQQLGDNATSELREKLALLKGTL